ncbi:MAG TPA: hypothetical protein VKA67_03400 [Verrucomicrobiae bacterium]|nr:hypothetical protein [Verrucomicrobiae bacterium]
MKKFTKVLLALTVMCFALGVLVTVGVIDASHSVDLGLLLPAGAVFLGLFLIWRVFEKEIAAFDAENGGHQTPGIKTTGAHHD